MKKIWMIFLMSSLLMESYAQNLVPNWSFEDTVGYPTSLTQINKATGWSSFRESPDYFNSCALITNFPFVSVSVPSNYWGYQDAKTGNGYAGLITYSVFSNIREFMGVELNQTLIIGQKYFVSFYVSRAASNLTHHNIASNKIGIRMSTVAYSDSNPASIDNLAQVYSDSIINDTLSWVKISGSFVADTAYKYLIIGNFFNDSVTSHIQYDSNFVNAVVEYNSIKPVQVYPNLFHDEITIEGNDVKSISIFDALGRRCIELAFAESLKRINTNNLSRGVYFIKVSTKTNSFIKKIIKQ